MRERKKEREREREGGKERFVLLSNNAIIKIDLLSKLLELLLDYLVRSNFIYDW